MENDADRTVPSEALLDSLMQIIKDTPERSVEYFCHEEYHCGHAPDYDAIRAQFKQVLSNIGICVKLENQETP